MTTTRGYRRKARHTYRVRRRATSSVNAHVHNAYQSGLSNEELFEQFRHDNPQVEDWLVEYCRDLKQRGVNRYSMDVLFGILRYERPVVVHGWLNNNVTPFYARLLMRKYPDLDEMFEVRTHKPKRQ